MGEGLRPLQVSLEGQVALITGGATRVGRVIALALAGRGMHVALTYLNDLEPYAQTASELAGYGVQTLTLPLDVRVPQAPARTVNAVVEHFGRLDILVNSAAIWLSAPFESIELQDWQMAIDVNLTGPFLVSQAVAPHMLRRRAGLILNITDLSAFQVWPGCAHHAASKAGLVALTRVMAVELAPYVRVNAIAPGTVLLPEGADSAKIRWAEEKSVLKRVGHPEDVARTVLFLADSDFATGGVYFVDGGRALVQSL